MWPLKGSISIKRNTINQSIEKCQPFKISKFVTNITNVITKTLEKRTSILGLKKLGLSFRPPI